MYERRTFTRSLLFLIVFLLILMRLSEAQDVRVSVGSNADVPIPGDDSCTPLCTRKRNPTIWHLSFHDAIAWDANQTRFYYSLVTDPCLGALQLPNFPYCGCGERAGAITLFFTHEVTAYLAQHPEAVSSPNPFPIDAEYGCRDQVGAGYVGVRVRHPGDYYLISFDLPGENLSQQDICHKVDESGNCKYEVISETGGCCGVGSAFDFRDVSPSLRLPDIGVANTPSSSIPSLTIPSPANPSPSTRPAPTTPPDPTIPTPTTPAPTTPSPTTPAPSTPVPATPAPTTPSPTTPSPTTPAPSNPAPTTPAPTTPSPTTLVPTTPAPTTPSPTTPAPSTPVPATPAPTTPSPTTPAPTTPVPTTPAPTTPSPTTPVPTTPSPTTPAPSTPVPATPAPTTPSPATPVPATPSPTSPVPTAPSPITRAPATQSHKALLPKTPLPNVPAASTPLPMIPAPSSVPMATLPTTITLLRGHHSMQHQLPSKDLQAEAQDNPMQKSLESGTSAPSVPAPTTPAAIDRDFHSPPVALAPTAQNGAFPVPSTSTPSLKLEGQNGTGVRDTGKTNFREPKGSVQKDPLLPSEPRTPGFDGMAYIAPATDMAAASTPEPSEQSRANPQIRVTLPTSSPMPSSPSSSSDLVTPEPGISDSSSNAVPAMQGNKISPASSSQMPSDYMPVTSSSSATETKNASFAETLQGGLQISWKSISVESLKRKTPSLPAAKSSKPYESFNIDHPPTYAPNPAPTTPHARQCSSEVTWEIQVVLPGASSGYGPSSAGAKLDLEGQRHWEQSTLPSIVKLVGYFDKHGNLDIQLLKNESISIPREERREATVNGCAANMNWAVRVAKFLTKFNTPVEAENFRMWVSEKGGRNIVEPLLRTDPKTCEARVDIIRFQRCYCEAYPYGCLDMTYN